MKNQNRKNNLRKLFVFFGLIAVCVSAAVLVSQSGSNAVVNITQSEKAMKVSVSKASEMKIPKNAVSSDETDQATKKKVIDSMKSMAIPFIENKGQMDDHVAFYLKTQGVSIFLTKKGETVFSFTRQTQHDEMNKPEHTHPPDNRRGDSRIALPHDNQIDNPEQIPPPHESNKKHGNRKRVVFKIIPEITAKNIKAYGQNKAKAIVNYFIGKKENWKGAISTYHEVAYDGIFPGTKMVYRSGKGYIEDIYELLPGADPSKIRFRVEGAKGLKTDDDGNLIVKTVAGEFMIKAPIAFQEIAGKRVETACSFSVDGPAYGFAVKPYNRQYALIIDPVLRYGTFLGGGNYESGMGIAVSDGIAYITGDSFSSEYPATSGAFDETYNGGDFYGDVILSMIAPVGHGESDLIYSTFIGGSEDECGYGVAVSGETVYITGFTASPNFPTTTGAYDETHNGNNDLFLTLINPVGNGVSDLVYSTFIGADNRETAWGIAVSEGRAYISGNTSSANYPVTPGAYDMFYNSDDISNDAILSIIAPDGLGVSDLVYSTFIGGKLGDFGHDVAVSNEIAYVTGLTYSLDYPTTDNAFDETYNGGGLYGGDIFFSVITPQGNGASDLVYSTYLGGSDGYDTGLGVAVSGGIAYITGSTSSIDYPVTAGAYDEIYNSGGDYNGDVFLSMIAPEGNGASDLVYSTFIGGAIYESGLSIAVSDRIAYISGRTASTNYPTTSDAYDETLNGGYDVVLSMINPEGNGASDLIYSTYIGGNNDEYGYALAVSGEKAYLTGEVSSPDFPITAGAYDETAGNEDAFLIVISFEPSADIRGAVFYQTGPAFDAPVPGVVLTLTGEETYSAESDINGAYGFSSNPIGDYTLFASKDDDVNGVTAYDAACTAQYAAELYEFDEYQILAADVTGNGEVTAYDAARIAQFAAELEHGSLAGTWTFIPGEYVYEPLESDQSDQNFTAILYGDVTGNWSPTNRNLEKDVVADTPVLEVIAFQFTLKTKSVLDKSFAEKFELEFPNDWNILTSRGKRGTWYVGGYGVTSISEQELMNVIETSGFDSKEFESFLINDKYVAAKADRKDSDASASIGGKSGGGGFISGAR